MLRRFLDGLVFGAGVAVAFVVIWSISMWLVIPRIMESKLAETRTPTFQHPTEAHIAPPDPKGATTPREYSFFKSSGARMEIPREGGILAMAPVSTKAGAKRPSTYQLWLTESRLWQIRTNEDKAEIESLPYPKNASVTDLERLMRENLGPMALQSTMTVSDTEIQTLKSSGDSTRGMGLNGKLTITVEGVVFVLPNPYET